MKTKACLLLFTLGLLNSGCEMYAIAARNLWFDTHLRIDEVTDCLRYRRLAERAYKEGQAGGNCPGSGAYHDGFVDGFSHYMWTNGAMGPPPIPPDRYWRPDYESSAGHQAIEDWYAGYARGAEVARGEGYRAAVVVPTPHIAVGPPVPAVLPGAAQIVVSPPADAPPAPPAGPAPALLPAPRPLTPPPPPVPEGIIPEHSPEQLMPDPVSVTPDAGPTPAAAPAVPPPAGPFSQGFIMSDTKWRASQP